MADVTFALTHPGTLDSSWPPQAQAPVRPDQESFFPVTNAPVSNSQGQSIFQRQDIPTVEARPVSNSDDSRFARSGSPVSNDSSATILGNPSHGPVTTPIAPIPNADINLVPPPQPVSNDRAAGTIMQNAAAIEGAPARQPSSIPPGTPVTNQGDVTFLQSSGGTITHGDGHATIHHPHSSNPAPPPRIFAPLPSNREPSHNPGHNTVSNEERRFVQASPVPLNFDGSVFIAPSAGSIQGSASMDSQIIGVVGTPLTADTDHTIGGGGEQARAPRSDEVSFSGRGKIDVGSTEVVAALVGDSTKTPGTEDVQLTPNAHAMGNQELVTGASGGDPLNSQDHTGFMPGARGNPLKKNVT